MYVSVCLCVSVARVGLMHIGVFILLLLSGERNFGVRLNKPYSVRVPMDIPVFTGSHADFLIIVCFHFLRIRCSMTNFMTVVTTDKEQAPIVACI